jgi:hypothetical protein
LAKWIITNLIIEYPLYRHKLYTDGIWWYNLWSRKMLASKQWDIWILDCGD